MGFRRAHIDLFPSNPSRSERDVEDGLRTGEILSLPDLVKFNARHNGTYRFCMQEMEGSGPTSITFQQLQKAVATCSQWLKETWKAHLSNTSPDLDETTHRQPVFALFLESDISIFIYITALLHCNYPCMVLSARLSSAAIHHLLRSVDAQFLLLSHRTLKRLSQTPLTADVVIAPTFADFLNASLGEKAAREGARATVVRGNDLSALLLHSSGTTGLPKAIGLAHRYPLGYACCHEFSADEDESQRGSVLSTLPLYHGFGLLAPCLSLAIGKPCLLPSSSVIPNGPLTIELISRPDVTSLMTVPSILDDVLAQCPTIPDNNLRKLDFVAVGGGGMKEVLGQKLHANGVKLLNHFGATELGALAPIFRPEKGYDWRFLRLRQDLSLSLRYIGKSERGKHLEVLSGIPFGHQHPWELQDRLELNDQSSRPEVRILGRLDDLIVLASGEKVLPNAFERAVAENTFIETAVIFGEGRFHVGVLVERSRIALNMSKDDFVNRVWETIEVENRKADLHAQVPSKAAVLVKPDDRPIPRSDKGSVLRKETYALFDSEIEAVYQVLENDDDAVSSLPLSWTNIQADVRTMALRCINGTTSTHLPDDTSNFVEQGFDSLGVTRLRRLLNAYVTRHQQLSKRWPTIPGSFVYLNPSVSSITAALEEDNVKRFQQGSLGRTKQMSLFLERYSSVPLGGQQQHQRQAGKIVLLTGSTGYLGAQTLLALLHRSDVVKIVCLLRPKAGKHTTPDVSTAALNEQLMQAMTQQGISISLADLRKCELLRWKPGEEYLGLSTSHYDRLATEVTHVMHAAWPMDFKRPLESFAPHIKALIDLIDLVAGARKRHRNMKPRLLFASSIAVVGQYPSHSGRHVIVPEAPLNKPEWTLPLGYAEGKWVCEQVLQRARHALGDESELAVVRIGQISGAEHTGYWNMNEHFPALLEISAKIQRLPRLTGTASWLPANRAALALTDILLDKAALGSVYQVENAIRQPWADIMEIVREHGDFRRLPAVPFHEWLDAAATLGQSFEMLGDFFRDHFERLSSGQIVLATGKSLAASPTLRATGSVRLPTVQLYIDRLRASQ